ncbi:MAG: bifunctional diaminohydroxyphosphoribosylaminopyrimidine deaminase/5-amino-6-(5-phosphoribosylamino)uracil reductase RibD [Actinomycetes bacterium]
MSAIVEILVNEKFVDEQVIDSQMMDQAMGLAIATASRSRRLSPPNPWVGAVVLSASGEVVGSGSTQAPGGSHAEVAALLEAGELARDGVLVVTLEPCNHQGRTPACTEQIIAAGISRVVVAIQDPDPLVSGSGIERLRSAGLQVSLGTRAAEVCDQLAPYLHQRLTGRAFCVVKTAMSLDARSVARDGTSQWITGPEARADAHNLRADSQAVVIGAGTALADSPSLNARDATPPATRQPNRVLLDARGRVPATGPLFDQSIAATIVFTTDSADSEALKAWRAAGAGVEIVEPQGSGVHLKQVLQVLSEKYGVLQAMVEGGAAMHAAFIEASLVDRVVAYVAPTFLGRDGRLAFDLDGPSTVMDASKWRITNTMLVGSDIRITLEPIVAAEELS